MAKIKLFCQNGNHYWERESQRGRRPFHCPEHMPEKPEVYARKSDAPKPKKALAPEHVEALIEGRKKAAERRQIEERQELQNSISALHDRIEKVSLENQAAYDKLIGAGGASKASNKVFDSWARTNGRLLNELQALRAREKSLERLNA